MSTSDMNTVATALGRMKSSDKAALEWLNIHLPRVPAELGGSVQFRLRWARWMRTATWIWTP